jgi:SSS family solute:Na+ symporter
MIASPIIGVWYWCTDQYIVQRTLAAKGLADARRGAIFGGYLKVLPVFLFLLPGMIGYALHQKGIIAIPSDANGNVTGDMVFPTMVASLLPTGLRGVVVAGVLSALMSSLASLFNSSATLFTVDIYERIPTENPRRRR